MTPTNELERRIGQLSAEKRALLERRLIEGGLPVWRPPAVPRRASDAPPAPASFAQQRLWFLDRLAPGTARYNLSEAFRLRGTLDVRALGEAIDALVARHDVLRTRLVSIDDDLVQVVDPPRPIDPALHDVSALPPPERERQAHAIGTAAAQRPFDIGAETMFRAHLVRLAPDDHVLIFVLHHAAADGLSMAIFNRELSALYANALHATEAALPAPAVRYADFAAWERDRAIAGGFDRGLTYWGARLSGERGDTTFPPDHLRPHDQPTSGARFELAVPEPLRESLLAFGRACGATPFMLMLAAFAVLLRRYGERDDVVIAIPVAGRGQPELHDLIGMFVNTAPLALDVAPAATFAELVAAVRAHVLEALEHDVPYDLLVQRLAPRRRTNAAPLAQVMFAYQSGMEAPLHFDGIDATPLSFAGGAAKFDISVDAIERDGRLFCSWEYADQLYDAQTVRGFAQQFITLLGAALAAPHVAIGGLDILPDEERRSLVALLRGAPGAIPERCIDELFREQALARPDATAVLDGHGRMSYRELDRRSDRLAERLRARGVGPERVVAVLLEPSTAVVVALLAVLKAGGAYLPLDERFPPERLRFVIEDAAPQVVLSELRFADRLPVCAAQRLFVDAAHVDEPAAMRVDAAPRHPSDLVDGARRDPSDLAYLIYTSGSTGQPKAVEVEHRSVVAFITAMIVRYGLRADDRLLQFSSVTFDASVEEIFGTLLAGATLVLPTPEMRDSGLAFARGCERLGVTVIDLPTAYFHHLVDELETAGATIPAAVRLAIVGGEALAPRAARSWAAHTRARLINAYGPTEATVVATAHDVQTVADAVMTIPIGRPLANVNLYVLDAARRLVPRGAVGTLYIAGPGLARGYRGRPDLTAQSFVPDPFGAAGARMYASGDLARISGPDGTLELCGRADGQVKIRGFRIETGEIEATLLRDPSVRDCVVVARDDGAGGKRLVAYIVPAASPVSARDLLRPLHDSLPDYMIPAIVVLEALPLAVNGKVDRAALPQADPAGETDEPSVPPRDELELALVAIWEELLDPRPIGVRDNFFTLGGHSLLAARMASRVERRLGARLSMRTLFAAQTIEAIAAVLRAEPALAVETVRRSPQQALDEVSPSE